MNEFINDNGDTVVIAEMDKWRLVHSIAKYAQNCSHPEGKEHWGPIVNALKAEAVRRMSLIEDKKE